MTDSEERRPSWPIGDKANWLIAITGVVGVGFAIIKPWIFPEGKTPSRTGGDNIIVAPTAQPSVAATDNSSRRGTPGDASPASPRPRRDLPPRNGPEGSPSSGPGATTATRLEGESSINQNIAANNGVNAVTIGSVKVDK